MAGLLSEYLRSAAGRQFAYGQWDCGLFLADWVALVKGIDPAADLRGRYRRLEDVPGIGGRRGLIGILTGLARRLGLTATRQPKPGDVALISIGGAAPVGAIRGDRGWFVLAEGGGISCAPSARLVKAWAL
jgi:hypothetical protein